MTTPYLPTWAQKSPYRAYFYRDNFRRLIWVNLILSLIAVGELAGLFYQYQTLTLVPVSYYATKSNGSLTSIDDRLIR